MADEISAKPRLPGWATSRWATSGWPTVFGTVAILFLATGCNCDNPNGAIHARVTQNGLDYVNLVLHEMLDKELRRITIPDINGHKSSTDYRISNMRITNLQKGAPSNNKILSTASGLRWTLSFQELQLTGNWWFKYKKGWIRISEDGNFRVTVRNMNLGVTLRPTTVNGKLAVLPASVVPSNCATIGDIDVRFGGSFWSWLLNLFKGLIGKKLRREIPPKVCDAAGKALHEWTAKIFPNMKTSDAIEIADEEFLADYGLLDPTFQTGVTTIRFKGEVWPSPKTFASFPFSPSPLPPLPSPASKHVYLTVSDFVANSLLFSAQKKGIGSETFDAKDIADSPEIKGLLSQFCSEQTSCDFNALSFSTRIVEAPNMDFSRSKGVTLKLKKGEVAVRAKLGDVVNDLVKVTIDVTLSAQPALSQDGRTLTFTFSPPVIHFDLIHPKIPSTQEQQIKNFVRLAGARYGLVALNRVGAKGIELPNVKGRNVLGGNLVDILDQELTVDDGALVLGANLVLRL